MPRPRAPFLCLALLAGLLAHGVAGAASWSADGSISSERTTDITPEGSESTETFEQSYSLAYETELTPSLQFTLDFTLDVTDEITEPGFDTRELQPAVDLGLDAEWWTLTANWDQSISTSHDPAEDDTTETTWEVEFTAEPEYEDLPDVSFRVEGDEDSIDRGLEGSLDYTFLDMLDITFDAQRDTTDTTEEDQDTEDRSYSLDVSLDRDLLDSLKFEAEWSNERDQSLTLSDDDVVLERDDTLSNNLRAQLTYTVLEDLELSLDREIDWSRDLEQGTEVEVTDTWSGEASYGRSLTEALGIDLSYSDERTDNRGGGSNSYAITRDYSASLDFTPLENLSVTPSFDRSDSIEWFDDPDQETSDSLDDTWEVQADASVWDDQIQASATRTYNFTWEEGEKTTDERSWDVDLSFALDTVPNLEVSPEYTFTRDRDELNDTTDEERTVDVNANYELSLGDVVTFSLDHTYTRTSTKPAEGEATVQRDDDTDLTLSWEEFLRGMGLELSVTRSASDESKDDQPPVIDYTYSATYDWSILDNYTFSFEYSYDKKDDPQESTRSFQTTFSMEFLEGLLTVDLEHEFDDNLSGTKDETHRYSIEIQGQF